MKDTIAVYMEDETILKDFCECSKIDILERTDSTWNKVLSFDIDFKNKINPMDIRNYTREIIDRIGECKIIAGLGMIGLPYNVFDRMGFCIFDIKEYNYEILDSILTDIENGNEMEKLRAEMIKNAHPVETEVKGNYYMDLITLMKECPDISSKKALMDFIKNVTFMELTLVCAHIPPWMETMNLDIKKINTENGRITAVISKLTS